MSETMSGAVLQGKYRIDRLIAEGLASRLFLGQVLDGAAQVAIKQLDVAGDQDREDFALFEKEFRILKGLNHPGLAQMLDFFEQDGKHYVVEGFVSGKSLQERIEQAGRIGATEAVDLMAGVLDALAYLHRHHLVYGELKAANVIVIPCGQVCLVDFGAARRWRRSAGCETWCAASEQDKSDPRSDVFSAGALLHHMLTGALAANQTWQPPAELTPDLPQALSDVVMKAVAMAPEQRYQSAVDMRQAVAGAVKSPGGVGSALGWNACTSCGQWAPHGQTLCKQCRTVGSPLALLSSYGPQGLALVLLLAVLAVVLVPNFLRARARGCLTACKSNLKNIATALEMYSTDNLGRYAPSLSALTPNYLKIIPYCPSAQSDRYSQAYVRSIYSPDVAGSADSYTVSCSGSHHTAAGIRGPGYPQYSSYEGLIVP